MRRLPAGKISVEEAVVNGPSASTVAAASQPPGDIHRQVIAKMDKQNFQKL
jgi:hypothetical protein